MKKKTYKILIVIIFLAGLSLLLYPFVANQWNNYRQKQLISDYDSIVSAEDAAGEIDYAAELEKARAYNEALLPSILPDSFAIAEATEGEDKAYMDCLNIAGDGIMGRFRRLISSFQSTIPPGKMSCRWQPDIWKGVPFR